MEQEKLTISGVDYDWLTVIEGGQQYDGYRPPFLKCGVTVATAVDLGQFTEWEFGRMGLSEPLLKKLKPYIGKTGEEAEQLLKKRRLFLEPWEADELDIVIRNKSYKGIEKYYNDAHTNYNPLPSGPIKKFEDLDSIPKSVIVSMAYNMGTNLRKVAPRSWFYILQNDWVNLERELVQWSSKFGKAISWRRKEEAKYLSKYTNYKIDEDYIKNTPASQEGFPRWLQFILEGRRKSFDWTRKNMAERAKRRKDRLQFMMKKSKEAHYATFPKNKITS